MTEPSELELEIASLAAGGDGVARDVDGRVTFVPRTAPGDRVRVRLTKQTKSFARGELIAVITPSPSRTVPPCRHFVEGCGGCQWQHVTRAAQLAAKQAIVVGALRKLEGLAIEPIADPAPPYGWRRRARFHVAAGVLGLFVEQTHRVLKLATCAQIDAGLGDAFAMLASSSLPDGEVALVRGASGAIAIGIERPWRGAAAFVGKHGIVGVIAGDLSHGEPVIEIEPGLFGGPWDFAQASAAGNVALIAIARAALGPGPEMERAGGRRLAGPARLLELHAGAGNFTRGFVADGWTVVATDAVAPAKPIAGARFEVGHVDHVVAAKHGAFDAIVLDPPRAGAAGAIDGIIAHAPRVIVYVSCDPATLARDATRLVAAGYRADRAWPVDLMPQTSHVEIVLRLVRS